MTIISVLMCLALYLKIAYSFESSPKLFYYFSVYSFIIVALPKVTLKFKDYLHGSYLSYKEVKRQIQTRRMGYYEKKSFEKRAQRVMLWMLIVSLAYGALLSIIIFNFGKELTFIPIGLFSLYRMRQKQII